MSGGSKNYLYSRIASDLSDYDTPSGHYGIGDADVNPNYESDMKSWRRINPMHDRELSEMMYDISCLLHSLEWYDSGDIDEERYKSDSKAFKKKWYMRTYQDRYESYKDDLRHMVKELGDEIEEN